AHAEAAFRTRPRLEASAGGDGSLAHAGQPVAGRRDAVGRPLALVLDGDEQVALAVVERHRRTVDAGVARDVGQGLLDDAVGGEVGRGRLVARLTGGNDAYLESRLSRPLDEVVQAGESRCGRALLLLVTPQHAERGAQLTQRLFRGL